MTKRDLWRCYSNRFKKPRLSEVEADWNREVQERIAGYDRGELQAFAADDLFADARRK